MLRTTKILGIPNRKRGPKKKPTAAVNERHAKIHKARESDAQERIRKAAVKYKWIMPGRKPPKGSIVNGRCKRHGCVIEEEMCIQCFSECCRWQDEERERTRA